MSFLLRHIEIIQSAEQKGKKNEAKNEYSLGNVWGIIVCIMPALEGEEKRKEQKKLFEKNNGGKQKFEEKQKFVDDSTHPKISINSK